MILKAEPFQINDLKGTKYTLEFIGDIFPTHTHTDNDVHITVMASGSAKCIGRPEIEGEIITAGDVIDWNPGEAHGFIACEDNTILVNVRKNYTP